MNEFKSNRSLNTEYNIKRSSIDMDNISSKYESSESKGIRKDKYGNIISKKNNSRYKISFADQVEKNTNLVEIYNVESYKLYNQEPEKKSKKSKLILIF